MNPSFMAFALGVGKYRGGKSPPKPSEQFAFAKGKGVQQEASGPEKEAKIDLHLAQLRKAVEDRTGVLGGNGYKREGHYPRSDMVQEMDDAIAEKENAT